MKSMKKIKVTLLGLLTLSVFAASVVVPASCGRRTPDTVKMRVGETIIVTPIPLEYSLSELPAQPPKKLILSFSSGGQQVYPNSGGVIKFYSSFEAEDPFYEIRAEDFPLLHLRTGCASSDVSLLDNAIESDVLICDGSLDVQRIRRMALEFPGGKKKSATSLSPESLESDLLKAGVMFQ
jgi:hypothetical protein